MLPKPHEDEIQFILDAICDYLNVKVRRTDVLSAWSGIRPLVTNPTVHAPLNMDLAGSPFTWLIKVCVIAYKKRKLHMVSDPKLLYENEELDACISITGARPDKAVSWRRIRSSTESVKVHCDVTILFPLHVAKTFAAKRKKPVATALFWMVLTAGNYGSTLLVSINTLKNVKGIFSSEAFVLVKDQIAIGDTIVDASTIETINDTISKAKIKVKELINAAQDKKVRARAWSNDDGVL
ncbi:glycerol-3-phosphate dehydrogenase SDP6, mitochondrial [Tanacetum coccineum]|uniref:glycerol-3-phosphate dehydrogenase n=1 Tax=Tanacetum coccineum TaxID=301880 RepID=A0ABQ5IS75_9ASTR